MTQVEGSVPANIIRLPTAGGRPMVSVIMANYRGADYLPAALHSVLSQSLGNLEVIVSDDASPDGSVGIVRDFMARDARVRLIEAAVNAGPAAARNAAFRAARGEWIAIVDSDDVLHPERFERMLAAASHLEADAVADNLLFFSTRPEDVRTLLGDPAEREPRLVSAEYFLRSEAPDLPSLGYLKPLFRRAAIGPILYDETVRIGEDYDFVLRFLLKGRRLFLLGEPLYLYRRHPGSISHRLSEADVLAMIASQDVFVREHGPFPSGIAALMAGRLALLRRAAAFEHLVGLLKKRRLAAAAAALAGRPFLLKPLLQSTMENMRRRFAKKAFGPADEPTIVVLAAGNAKHSDNASLQAAIAQGGAAKFVIVPDYRAPDAKNVNSGSDNGRLIDLARLGVRAEARIVCHGLAGLRAAGFLPRKTIVGVVLDEPLEAEQVMSWASRISAPLIVPDALRETLRPEIAMQRLCPGFHRVEAFNRAGMTGVAAVPAKSTPETERGSKL